MEEIQELPVRRRYKAIEEKLPEPSPEMHETLTKNNPWKKIAPSFSLLRSSR